MIRFITHVVTFSGIIALQGKHLFSNSRSSMMSKFKDLDEYFEKQFIFRINNDKMDNLICILGLLPFLVFLSIASYVWFVLKLQDSRTVIYFEMGLYPYVIAIHFTLICIEINRKLKFVDNFLRLPIMHKSLEDIHRITNEILEFETVCSKSFEFDLSIVLC